MKLTTLRKGDKGKQVTSWQYFLRGTKHYLAVVDGDFGPKTYKATQAFQKSQRLKVNGEVGIMEYARAMLLGFNAGIVETDKNKLWFPPEPDFNPLVGNKQREALFGKFDYKNIPTARNPEKIKILGNWTKENIVMVDLPQLSKATGGKYTRMRFHKLAQEQLKGFWSEIEKKKLLDRVLTYSGAFYPRYVRGSKTNLSNHSWGTAFDINVKWNGLGRKAASVGDYGCVLELVPIANDFGFYWGGHFRRKDGMHFEIAELL